MAMVYDGRDRVQQSSTTATAGGTITLTGAAPAGSYNFRDLYANGAIVALTLEQSGVFECGYGTLVYGAGPTTDTITTRTVLFSSSGVGATITWGAGTRNAWAMISIRSALKVENALAELLGREAAARGHIFAAGLPDANTFTANQLIQAAYLELGRATNEWLRAERLTTEAYLQCSSEKTAKEPLFISSLFRGTGVASGECYIQFFLGDAGGPNAGPKIRETGALETGAGLKYVAIAGGNVTKWLWGSAPPTGWTRSNEADDRMIKTAKSSESAGDSGGSWTISGLSVSGNTDSHALLAAEIPAHTHTVSYTVAQVPSGGGVAAVDQIGTGGSSGNTGSAGSGGGHTHGTSGVSVASAASWRPLYKVWVAATLD